MRFYKHTHAFYAGVDLHARSMFTHILDNDGKTVFEADLPASPEAFRNAIAPYRAGLVVGCECMFSWYWLADLCEDDEIPFTLGHALYMRAIHGGKAKNDRIDAAKIAGLLRGGMFPMAYVYPRAKRDTRDLLRRRCHFVNQRAQLTAHIVNTNSQYNHPPLTRKLCYASNRSDDPGSATSNSMTAASPPEPRMSEATFSSRSARRAANITRIPARAMATAVAAPMPELAPVTMATRF